MKLWIVTTHGDHGYITEELVRATTAVEAAALTLPWAGEKLIVEPLTYEGEPGVIMADDR